MSDQSDSAPAAQGPASPFRLNLKQQRKRAKELLKGLRAGDTDALHRFHLHHPKLQGIARLSEAQLVIARELGLQSWPRLKAHIEAMHRSWSGIASGGPAPDRGPKTLHVRCGSDIEAPLKQAGFTGDFLEYSDPLCQGPVVDRPDWLRLRTDFLAQAFGPGSHISSAQIGQKLHLAEERLQSAATSYERIVLWFEHDSYDQLILARCLAQFAEAAPAVLELISPAHYPGGTRFIGLGQLPPEALRLLWEDRTPVSVAALSHGRAAWDALRSPDPRSLAALARAGTAGIPQLGRALRRHCQEFPWTTDGLGLTERLTLQLIAEEPQSVGLVFSRLTLEREPLPWMSDLIFRNIVEAMLRADRPVFSTDFQGKDRRWFTQLLTITPLGRAVLAGEIDWLSLHPPARWLGAVRFSGATPCWRWEEETLSMVNC